MGSSLRHYVRPKIVMGRVAGSKHRGFRKAAQQLLLSHKRTYPTKCRNNYVSYLRTFIFTLYLFGCWQHYLHINLHLRLSEKQSTSGWWRCCQSANLRRGKSLTCATAATDLHQKMKDTVFFACFLLFVCFFCILFWFGQIKADKLYNVM